MHEVVDTALRSYGSGDLVKDTNAHSGPNFDCTAGTSTCGSFGLPIENYMNYTPDTCMTKFTAEQVNRMRCSLINFRSELVDIETGGNVPPTANFTSSANNLVVSFTDTSTDSDGTITARAWTFGDAVPPARRTSSSRSPAAPATRTSTSSAARPRPRRRTTTARTSTATPRRSTSRCRSRAPGT